MTNLVSFMISRHKDIHDYESQVRDEHRFLQIHPNIGCCCIWEGIKWMYLKQKIVKGYWPFLAVSVMTILWCIKNLWWMLNANVLSKMATGMHVDIVVSPCLDQVGHCRCCHPSPLHTQIWKECFCWFRSDTSQVYRLWCLCILVCICKTGITLMHVTVYNAGIMVTAHIDLCVSSAQ